MIENQITDRVIGAAITVHESLGPGLLESTYKACLVHELALRGVQAVPEVPIPLIYKGVELDCGFRADLVVEDLIVVELKSVERLEPVHTAQLITYLRLMNRNVGLLLNFNVERLIHGLRRIVLDYTGPPPRPPRPPR